MHRQSRRRVGVTARAALAASLVLLLSLPLISASAGCGGDLSGGPTASDAPDASPLSTDASPPDDSPPPPTGDPPPASQPPQQPPATPPPSQPPADGPQALPVATKPCPKIVEGDVAFLGKKVRVWVDPHAAARKGPLVFYWHGTGSSPLEVLVGLGMQAIGEIKAQGGIVVAPFGPTGLSGSMTGGVVWNSGDLALADEILACAAPQVGVDTRRIHSMGMSAGGLHTTIMSYSRSGYLASAASFSGGLVPILPPPPSQYPTNKLPVMIVHGGTNDQLNWFSFKESSQRYLAALRAAGHFAFICDHGMGHTIPPGGGAGAWRFFKDHPWRANPEPYQPSLPAGLPGTCTIH